VLLTKKGLNIESLAFWVAMNKTGLLLLVTAAITLSGCSHSYVMKMTNNSRIVTANKPKLKNGFYVYKDAKGNEHSVSQGRISEIEPLSMADEKPKRK
jgi:hypothetical protein